MIRYMFVHHMNMYQHFSIVSDVNIDSLASTLFRKQPSMTPIDQLKNTVLITTVVSKEPHSVKLRQNIAQSMLWISSEHYSRESVQFPKER